jgi:hypothetical protein
VPDAFARCILDILVANELANFRVWIGTLSLRLLHQKAGAATELSATDACRSLSVMPLCTKYCRKGLSKIAHYSKEQKWARTVDYIKFEAIIPRFETSFR